VAGVVVLITLSRMKLGGWRISEKGVGTEGSRGRDALILEKRLIHPKGKVPRGRELRM